MTIGKKRIVAGTYQIQYSEQQEVCAHGQFHYFFLSAIKRMKTGQNSLNIFHAQQKRKILPTPLIVMVYKHVCFATRSMNHQKYEHNKTHAIGFGTDFGHFAKSLRISRPLHSW